MQTAQNRDFCFAVLFFQNTHNAQLIRWRNTIHRTLIFILLDPLANRGHSISKWLLLNSCYFLKNAKSTEWRFLFSCAFFQNTHNAHLIYEAEHHSQDSCLYLEDPSANREHSVSKWLLFNSCRFLNHEKQHRIENFVLLSFFAKHAQRTSDIKWRNTTHRTLISICKTHQPIKGTLYQNGFFSIRAFFLKHAKCHRIEFFVLLCFFFFQNTHNAHLI